MRSVILVMLAATAASPPLIRRDINIAACIPPTVEEADLLASFYPARAKSEGREGLVMLDCGRSEQGRPVNCAVTSESPGGYGFGDAALALAAAQQDNPRIHYNSGATNDHVPIPFKFSLFPTRITPNVFSGDRGAPTIVQLPDLADELSAGKQIAGAYPRRLIGGNPPGRVLLDCDIAIDGHAKCRVLEENPPERGFGSAALRVAANLKFEPLKVNGKPCSQGKSRVPITFLPPR